MRRLDDCAACARDHAWGGDTTFDAVRLALAYHRLRRWLPPGDVTVLEVGFGHGRLLRRFIEAGATAYGVDPDMLEARVDSVVRERAHLLRVPVEDAALEPGSVDLVYAIHVAEHLLAPLAALRRCREALRPGGVCYLLTPDADSAGLRVFRSHWWNLEDPTHVRFFSADSVTRVLTAAGFSDVRVRRTRLDSISMETCSVARALRQAPSAHGVLSSGKVRAAATVLTPATAVLRAGWPALSPTIEAVARRPGGTRP